MLVCKVCECEIKKVSTDRVKDLTYYIYFCDKCKQVRGSRSIKVVKRG